MKEQEADGGYARALAEFTAPGGLGDPKRPQGELLTQVWSLGWVSGFRAALERATEILTA